MENVQSLQSEIDNLVSTTETMKGPSAPETIDVKAKATAARIALATALSAEESSTRMETATKRLANLILWLVVSTAVLALATGVLVVVTATR
jgi:hypothetical protein